MLVPKDKDGNVVEIPVAREEEVVLAQTEAANRMAGFWDRLIVEFNMAKALAEGSGAAESVPGEELSTDTGPRRKLGREGSESVPRPRAFHIKPLRTVCWACCR